MYKVALRNYSFVSEVKSLDLQIILTVMLRTQLNNLDVRQFTSRDQMAKSAAKNVAKRIEQLLTEKQEIRMVFAAAPSQSEFLNYLVRDSTVAWDKINAFHMDEYIGLSTAHPQSFGYYLDKNIFSKVNFKSVNYINGNANDLTAECDRYSHLIRKAPIDIVCLGIGENGHLAFNDPHNASFTDSKTTKTVELDDTCRTQQVNDGCFSQLSHVPKQAITLTIPTLTSANYLFCIVPGKRKATAVYRTLFSEISKDCPSTVLRIKENAILYLDGYSSEKLKRNQDGRLVSNPKVQY